MNKVDSDAEQNENIAGLYCAWFTNDFDWL